MCKIIRENQYLIYLQVMHAIPDYKRSGCTGCTIVADCVIGSRSLFDEIARALRTIIIFIIRGQASGRRTGRAVGSEATVCVQPLNLVSFNSAHGAAPRSEPGLL